MQTSRKNWTRPFVAAAAALSCAAIGMAVARAGGARSGKTGSSAQLGYVWANQPSSASYTPSLTYQFNSAGGTNTITRSGVGQYTVHFPGLSTLGGHVQVTAYGG